MERKVRYIPEGNAVRKIYEFPEREREREKKVHREPHRRTYRQEEQAQRMSLKMVFLLALSVMVSVLSCINYLNTQADIAETKNAIASLESGIDTLVTRNDSMQYEIDSFVDVEYIMKVATEELGMVMVNEGQVVIYDSTRNEFMEQYGDVPEK